MVCNISLDIEIHIEHTSFEFEKEPRNYPVSWSSRDENEKLFSKRHQKCTREDLKICIIAETGAKTNRPNNTLQNMSDSPVLERTEKGTWPQRVSISL